MIVYSLGRWAELLRCPRVLLKITKSVFGGSGLELIGTAVLVIVVRGEQVIFHVVAGLALSLGLAQLAVLL